MKKLLLLTTIILLSLSALFAQNLELMKADGSSIVNDSITITTTDNSSTINVPVYVKNNDNKSMDVLVKVYTKEMVSGSSASYCWGSSCFDIATNQPDAFTTIAVSDTSKEFHSDYEPNENTGLSEIMYTFYNKYNSDDSISVTIYYNVTTTTGIADKLNEIKESIRSYPNPVQNTLHFNYNLKDNTDASVAVYDIVGKRIKHQIINFTEKSSFIDVSDIKPGVYIWTFEVEGVPIKSEKILKR